MKKSTIMKRNILISLLLLVSLTGYSQRFDKEKSRVIEKQYVTDGSQTLAVENSFGKIQIETWNKNEITVQVELIARAESEKEAQRVLDKLEVDIDESPSSISLETKINSQAKNSYGKAFEIHYSIKLPATNAVEIINKFGDVFVDSRKGKVMVDLSYGALKAERLEGESEIELAFGSGFFEYLAESEIEIKYSNVEVEEATSLRIEEGFSDLEIRKVAKLDLQSKYGNVDIVTVGEIIVDIRFSDFKIEKLTKSIDMYGAYVSDFEIGEVAGSVDRVELETKFGTSELTFAADFHAVIDADLKFSDLSYRDLDLKFSRQITSGNSKEYYGILGPDDNTEKLVKIESSYGNYKLKRR